MANRTSKNKDLYKDLIGICYAPQDTTDLSACPRDKKWNECTKTKPCKYYSNFLSAKEFIYGSKYSPRSWSPESLLLYVDYAISHNNKTKLYRDPAYIIPAYKNVQLSVKPSSSSSHLEDNPPQRPIVHRQETATELYDWSHLTKEDVEHVKKSIVDKKISGDKLLNMISDIVNYIKLNDGTNDILFEKVLYHVSNIFSKKMVLDMFKDEKKLDTNFRYFFADLYNTMKKMDQYINEIPETKKNKLYLWTERVGEFYDHKYADISCSGITLYIDYDFATYIIQDKYVDEKNEHDLVYLRVKKFIDEIAECLKRSSYIIVLLNLRVEYDDIDGSIRRSNNFARNKGHRNILFYNNKKNILERYEPHEANNSARRDTKFLDDVLRKIFSYTRIGRKYKYIMPTEVCPSIVSDMPLYDVQSQSLEEDMQHKANISKDGYCVTWSYAYFINRVAYPAKTYEQITKDMMGNVQVSKMKNDKLTEEYGQLVNMLSIELYELMENIILVSKLDQFYRKQYPKYDMTFQTMKDDLNKGKKINMADISRMIFQYSLSMDGNTIQRDEFKNTYGKITAYIDKTEVADLLYDDIVTQMIGEYGIIIDDEEDITYHDDLNFIIGVICKTERIKVKLNERIAGLRAEREELTDKIVNIDKENKIIADIQKITSS